MEPRGPRACGFLRRLWLMIIWIPLFSKQSVSTSSPIIFNFSGPSLPLPSYLFNSSTSVGLCHGLGYANVSLAHMGWQRSALRLRPELITCYEKAILLLIFVVAKGTWVVCPLSHPPEEPCERDTLYFTFTFTATASTLAVNSISSLSGVCMLHWSGLNFHYRNKGETLATNRALSFVFAVSPSGAQARKYGLQTTPKSLVQSSF